MRHGGSSCWAVKSTQGHWSKWFFIIDLAAGMPTFSSILAACQRKCPTKCGLFGKLNNERTDLRTAQRVTLTKVKSIWMILLEHIKPVYGKQCGFSLILRGSGVLQWTPHGSMRSMLFPPAPDSAANRAPGIPRFETVPGKSDPRIPGDHQEKWKGKLPKSVDLELISNFYIGWYIHINM